jgi:hypothetical protein
MTITYNGMLISLEATVTPKIRALHAEYNIPILPQNVHASWEASV